MKDGEFSGRIGTGLGNSDVTISGTGADTLMKADAAKRGQGGLLPDRRTIAEAVRQEEHLRRLGYLAGETGARKAKLDNVYWPLAEEKGIRRDRAYVIGGKEFKVLRLEISDFGGKNCYVVLRGGDSGLETKRIKLDDRFWLEEQAKERGIVPGKIFVIDDRVCHVSSFNVVRGKMIVRLLDSKGDLVEKDLMSTPWETFETREK